MPIYILRETIVREYEVEANDIASAYEKVMNTNEVEYSEESEGISDIVEIPTNKQTIL